MIIRRERVPGARATQALRLLESLGRPAVAGDGYGADMQPVLQRVEAMLRPIMPYGHSLELHNAVTIRPLVDGDRLAQLIVYLALQLKPQDGVEGRLLIRVYEGLGDVSRADGRRTWTIVDIGGKASHGGRPTAHGPSVTDGARTAEHVLELPLRPLGARLDLETRDGRAFFVRQLPSR